MKYATIVTLRGELLYSGPVVGWFSLFQSPPEKLKKTEFSWGERVGHGRKARDETMEEAGGNWQG